MKILNAILCEDIRKEDNGKFILIGVFVENVIINTFPAAIPAAWWVQFTVDKEGETEMEFQVRVDGKGRASMPFKAEVNDITQPITIGLPGLPIVYRSEGELSLHLREKGGRWKLVKRIPVLRGE